MKSTKKTEELSNQQEKQVIEFLHKNGRTMYGNIIKELNTGVKTGQEIIFSLLSKGIIRKYNNSSYLELNMEPKE